MLGGVLMKINERLETAKTAGEKSLIIARFEYKKIIADRLRSERVKHGISQDELADLLELKSRQTVANWENSLDDKTPDAFYLEEMSNIFDCDIAYLVGESPDRQRVAVEISERIGLSETSVHELEKDLEYLRHQESDYISFEHDFISYFIRHRKEVIAPIYQKFNNNFLLKLYEYDEYYESIKYAVETSGIRASATYLEGLETVANPPMPGMFKFDIEHDLQRRFGKSPEEAEKIAEEKTNMYFNALRGNNEEADDFAISDKSLQLARNFIRDIGKIDRVKLPHPESLDDEDKEANYFNGYKMYYDAERDDEYAIVAGERIYDWDCLMRHK